jgi:hypothetical protein
MQDVTDLFRHLLSTIAYRFHAATAHVPVTFGTFNAGTGVRTPNEIIRHMTHLMIYTQRRFVPTIDVSELAPLPFDEEVSRFYRALKILDQQFVDVKIEHTHTLNTLLQGPLADAITHIGQLAMLSRLSGYPVPGQRYTAAAIESGKLDF